MLENLGLDRHVLDVYRSMLTHRDWGVAEIADDLALDTSVVRRSLDRLVELELLRTSWERPGHWRPVNPDVGLAALVSREQADVARRQEQIERARRQVADLVTEISSTARQATADVEHLTGMDEIRGQLESLARETREEALAFTPGASQSPESFEASGPLDQAALARGVNLKTLYQTSVRNDVHTRRYVQWLSELGGESRLAPTLPLRMVISDRTIAVLPLDPANSRAGALVVRAPGMIAGLTALFDAYWRESQPFGEQPSPGDPGEPTSQEIEILRMLAAGAKDEAIARALGVSLRTTRRCIADLMQRLDASSRFQAGCTAVRRGWI